MINVGQILTVPWVSYFTNRWGPKPVFYLCWLSFVTVSSEGRAILNWQCLAFLTGAKTRPVWVSFAHNFFGDEIDDM